MSAAIFIPPIFSLKEKLGIPKEHIISKDTSIVYGQEEKGAADTKADLPRIQGLSGGRAISLFAADVIRKGVRFCRAYSYRARQEKKAENAGDYRSCAPQSHARRHIVANDFLRAYRVRTNTAAACA